MTALPGRVVLVLQGGGALGAYQVGVYQALHEAGIEPEWVIGTSIGAFNAAVIACNGPEERLPQLRRLWERFERADGAAEFSAVLWGIPGFFTPRLPVLFLAPRARCQPLALVEPHLHANRAIGRKRFGKPVVDVCPQRLERQLAVQIPLGPGDLGAVQAP